MATRRKCKTVTLYVDPKYDGVLLYLKHTIGITAFIEGALDKVVIDPDKFNLIQQLHKIPNG